MREYFEKQFEGRPPITEEDLSKLESTPEYDEYKVGDQILVFMEQQVENDQVILNVKIVTERTLDRLKSNYKFIRMGTESIPVLEKK